MSFVITTSNYHINASNVKKTVTFSNACSCRDSKTQIRKHWIAMKPHRVYLYTLHCVCTRRLATTILIRVHLYPPHHVCARRLVTTVPIQCPRLATCSQRLATTTPLHPNARLLAIYHQNFGLLQVLRRILHLLLHQYETNSWDLLRCQFETNSWLTCTSKL